MASSNLPEAGAKLELDLSQWEKNWASAMDDAETLTSALDDMAGSIDVDINLDIPDVSEFDEITALDGETITPELDTTETDTSKEIRDGISFLATIEKIKIAIDVIGTAWEFIQKIGNVVVAPFLDVEDAVARINAQTGGTGIADLGGLIRELQFADLGDSVDQISDVVIAADQLNQPIKDAATAALTFTHTWQDEDPTAVLTPLVALVETGLVPSLQDAADLMTVFFQEGGNKGQDALNVVQANAQSWADMGLTGAEALSAINSLLDSGVDSGTDAAKMIQTLDDALTAAADNADSPQAEALKTLGMENPKDSGLAMGADFIDGFAESFATLPPDKQDLISGVLFGKGGKKFTGALEGLTTQGGMFADIVGAAEEAAAAADDSLRGVIDDFVLAINEKISELLSSEAIDLPGKISALKTQLQTALDTLVQGGSIGEAIEAGFGIQGVDDALNNVQRVFGQLLIGLLEIVATIQDPLGLNDNDKAARAQIKTLAAQQLPFDIKVANPEELDTIFAQAMARGLSAPEAFAGLTTALDELVAQGDFSKVNDILNEIISNPDVSQEAIAALTTKYESMIAQAQAAMKPVSTKEDTAKWLGGWMNQDQGTGGLLGTLAADAQTALTDLDTANTTATENMQTNWNEVGIALTDDTAIIVGQFEATAAKVGELDDAITERTTGNTITTSFDAVAMKAAETFPAVIAWFERTTQAAARMDAGISLSLRSILKQLNDLNFLTMQTIGNLAQLPGGTLPEQPVGAGAGAGGPTTFTTNTVTVNNTMNGPATAAANGYAIASSLRPGGR